jgi:hypothetical protein
MKSTKFAFIACAVVAFACFASADPFTGPTSTFYMSVGQTGTIFAVQGTTFTTFAWAYDAGGGSYGEALLAVSAADGVSTAPSAQSLNNGVGGQYSLAGVPSGVANDANHAPALDATSDGTHNFYVTNGGSDNVYESNLDWSDPTILFSTSSLGGFQGIGYDPVNNSLWMSQNGADLITNVTPANIDEIADFSLTGTLLSSFVYNTTAVPHVEAFGFDPADDTLWGEVSQTGELAQWNTSGTLLQEGTPTGLEHANFLGGDFEEGGAGPITTPEPATLLLTGSGILMFVRRLRKK